jgi:pyruvate/2-oxoglutarate dehydrogenase complex dihydrolipoamide acyltransferase (E2) component
MREIRMPQIALGDEEVTIVAWFKEPGEVVAEGEPLLEIETEKASMEVEAPFGGTLASRLAAAGDVVSTGQLIATLDGDAKPPTVPSPEPAVTVAVPSRPDAGVPAPPRRGAPASLVEHGELRGIRTASPPTRVGTPAGARPEPLSRRRLAIARRLSEAAAIPQFSVAREIPTAAPEAAVAAARDAGVVATLTDAFLLALGRAAADVPRANAWLVDDTLELFARVSVALAVDTPEGVLAPVVHNADTIDIGAVAQARAALVERARAGRLAQSEIEGATITLSNVGGLGGDSLVPVITPPQVAVVGVGRSRPTGSATFTFVGDHRALDGADGARFLAALERELQALDPT